ncbi:hypothetical protein QEV61_04795 [Trueperella pyogenes]|uniref:hypothetical protein n=1 Tax=Trueperella pyogenes TaxID=1661 RepID=UPI003253989C
MYNFESIAGQHGTRQLRQQFPAEIGAKPQLTPEERTQLNNLRQTYYQDLRNRLITECTEYAAGEITGAGYTAEQVRGIIEEDRHREYGNSDAYRELERLAYAGIISAVYDAHIPLVLAEALGIPMEFSDECIPGDIILGDPAFELATREEILAWNRQVVFGDGVNLKWVLIFQIALQIHIRHGEQILEAAANYM